MHLDDERVQHFLQRELPLPETVMVEAHLAQCVSCRGMVAAAAQEIDDVNTLLMSVDHPAPRITAEMVVASAAARGIEWRRWAAGVLLVLTLGGAAYAAPGSPIPGWTRTVASWAVGRQDPTRPAPPPVTPLTEIAGVAVTPGAELVIDFAAPQTKGRVEVRLTDAQDVVVRTVTGGATFTSDPGRLLIQNQGATADFEIEIPRTAPRVEIRVGDARILLKTGSRVTTDASGVGGDTLRLRIALPRS